MSCIQKLSNLVWELRFWSIASQTAHWRVFGPTSYSDHTLYGQIYEKLSDLLDPLAERLTAMAQFDDEKYVDPLQQAKYVYSRMKTLGPPLKEALLSADSTSLFFYQELLSLSRKFRRLSSSLKKEGMLTLGLEDLLATTANEIEILVFFLERRSQSSAAVPSSPLGPVPMFPPHFFSY